MNEEDLKGYKVLIEGVETAVKNSGFAIGLVIISLIIAFGSFIFSVAALFK